MQKPMTASILFLFLVMLVPFSARAAGDDVCARVKIEIRQELTLERQGFDAHMRITNGLAAISLENVRVQVSFTDQQGNGVPASSDPENANALFFIRVDEMQNIDDVGGSGTVAPASAADIHWLIIPAPGSSNGLQSGQMYYVGAVLTYTVNGETHTTEVSPDYIFVKPMPQLSIDYFLPDEVFADDAFTADIEPPVPFTLGVRVKNSGAGVARGLKIDSAQPKIVENELGLLINFMIDGSTIGDQPAVDSLLADFGDIAPAAAKTARWVMHCSLSGKFVAFSAEFSHSNELGGELTSLIEAVNTHFLVRDVRVDLPGRDQVRDFLARDGGIYRVYESQNTESEVLDQSALSGLQRLDQTGSEIRYALTTAPAAGLLFVRLPDPFQGRKFIKAALRSDGKRIKAENIWLSKTRDGHGWKYFVNLFDAAGTDRYTLTFDDPAALPQAPVLQFIPDKTRVEGEQLSFLVAASDPDGTVPVLSAAPLPAGAHFTDQGGGRAIFDWTPAIGQAGNYLVGFTASDGTFSASESVTISVYRADDTDGDGLDDSWERAFFGNLDRDGHGDFDGDGFSDRDEFKNGTDPTRENNVPGVPLIAAPLDGDEVAALTPVLVVNNSTDPDGDPVTYEFEVYSDSGLRTLVARESKVTQGTDTTTAWQVPAVLEDNHMYTWRVCAADGFARSFWQYGSFFVNTANDAPGAFHASRPRGNGHVCTLSPELQVTNAGDADGDQVAYAFEVYADDTMATLIAASGAIAQGAGGSTSWVVDAQLDDANWYFWRALATDEHGRQSQTALMSFYVDTQNSAPQRPFISSPADDAHLPGPEIDLVVANSSDPQGDPLTYYFEIDTVNTFDSPRKQVSPEVQESLDVTGWRATGLSDNTTYFWRVKASDGYCESDWEQGRFFVNRANDAPPVPVAVNPGNGAWATMLTPALILADATDADNDSLTYAFELYADEQLTDLVQQYESSAPQWQVASPLADKTKHYWRARAVDPQGAAGPWMSAAAFFVKDVGMVEPPENIEVRVTSGAGAALAGIHVYAFTAAGAYAGLSTVTDENGSALFEPSAFSDGDYKFRADYLGRQFWSETTAVPEKALIEIIIAHESVNLSVAFAGQPAYGARVYLFSETGSYLGVFKETDANGEAAWTLPTASGFKFRTDLSGSQYWTDAVTVSAAGPNDVMLDAGGGTLQVTLEEDPQTPLPAVDTYLFGASDSYLGRHQETDVLGAAAFSVPAGTYKVRADYLGYYFWSPDTVVGDDTPISLVIAHQDVGVDVGGVFQGIFEPLAGINAYLFTPAGSYLNRKRQTDADGRVSFHLPEEAYKVRADYLGRQFWSPEFTWQDAVVEIPLADAEITVVRNGDPIDGVPVYVFSVSGSYLNLTDRSDAAGKVRFRLAAGRYKFRADYQGSQYWSGDEMLAADQETPIEISTGGGTFTFKLFEQPGVPLAGVSCYVFSDQGAYLNLSSTTDTEGESEFDLASGVYKFRADYMGYQFWSETIEVPEKLSEIITIAHQDVAITVETDYPSLEPLTGVKVYLFTPSGSYLNRQWTTDAGGKAVLHLPDKPYKVRVDYLGQQFWSDVFQFQDTTVNIHRGVADIHVQRSGADVAAARVYLFSENGAYLSWYEVTDGIGKAAFALPDRSFKFRIDEGGNQYWSDVVVITPETPTSIEVDLDDF